MMVMVRWYVLILKCYQVPKWKGCDNSEDEAKLEKADDEDANKGWHQATYVPPQSGRLISIKAQPSELQRIIRAAIRRVTGDIIFENAYVSSDEIISYNQQTLSTVATELEENKYVARFQKDHNFGVVVGRVVCFFSNLKKLADTSHT